MKIKLFILLNLFIMNQVKLKGQNLPTHNPDLPFIEAKKSQWTGNPIVNKQYQNHEFPYTPEFKDVRKWKSQKNPYEAQKKIDKSRLKIAEHAEKEILDTQDGLFWLGHATFLIRLGGKTFITDPV